MAELYDAHFHLQAPELTPHLPGVIASMQAIRVRAAVVNGTTEADWPAVRQLALEHPWIIPAYGLHPWYLDRHTPDWEQRLTNLLSTDPRATVGEIGLDHWMRHPDRPLQQRLLRRQLSIARDYQRPATLHCLRAWGTLLALLRESPPPPFLLHAYSGPVEMIGEFVALGAYFSFSGYFLTPGKESKIAPFLKIPRDRLLIETDAPSMPLPDSLNKHPLPDGINHPANLAAIYSGYADALQIPGDELPALVAANFQRLFGRAS